MWAELFECLPIARAFFGASCEEQVHAFWTARARISTAAHMYGSYEVSEGKRERYEDAFWEGLDEGKEGSVTAIIADAVAFAEKNVLPVVAGESR